MDKSVEKSYEFHLNTKDEPGCNICSNPDQYHSFVIVQMMRRECIQEFSSLYPKAEITNTFTKHHIDNLTLHLYVIIKINYYE